MYCLLELGATSILQRISDGHSALYSFLLPISLSVGDIFKIVRFGKLTSSPHPLKIIGNNKDITSSLIKDFNSNKQGGSVIPDFIRFVRDETIFKRELLYSCHTELDQGTK